MRSIFGLIDPGTGWIRYVGSTKVIGYGPTDWLAFLHRTHQMQLNKGRRHATWEALMQQPELHAVLLERTEDPNGNERWVKLLHEADHPLLNKRYEEHARGANSTLPPCRGRRCGRASRKSVVGLRSPR